MKEKIIQVLQNQNCAVGDCDLTDIATAIEVAIKSNDSNSNSLIIVANRGIHALDESRFPAGDVLYASEGNLGGSPFNADDLKSDLETAVKVVAAKLKANHYQQVYIVPSGFAIISQMITATVIQINANPPVILQYDRETGDYWPISLEIRRLVSETK
jgi:hypothetical protein